jgi:hypothetical protein
MYYVEFAKWIYDFITCLILSSPCRHIFERVPVTVCRSVTLRGLGKLETKIKEAYDSGYFKGVKRFEDLTTEQLCR